LIPCGEAVSDGNGEQDDPSAPQGVNQEKGVVMSQKAEKEKRRAERTKTLNVFERLLIRNIIPQMEGWNFGSMKEARLLMESLFDEQEEEALQIKPNEDGRGITWRVAEEDGTPIPQDKELRFSEGLLTKLQKFLKQLNDQEKLEFQHYTLYEKIVGE